MDENTAWMFLLIASVLEPCWAIALEKSDNFKNKLWVILAIVLVLSCLYTLSLAVSVLGPGFSYAILAGIGAIGVVIAGYFLYKERITVRRITFIALIIVGVIGVRLVSGGAI